MMLRVNAGLFGVGIVAVIGSVAPAWGVVVTMDFRSKGLAVPAAGVGLHSSVYANQWLNPSLSSRIVESGIDMLRFPGGSYSDIYHFSNNTATGGYVANGANFATFAKLLTSASIPGMVTVNYGSSMNSTMGGQPQEAAAWVAYANGSPTDTRVIGLDAEGNNWKTVGYWAGLRAAAPLATNDGYNFLRISRTAPVGIKYWEVGNEIFGNGYYATYWNWENDLHSTATDAAARVNQAALSPTAYGTNFNAYAAAMKAVDPTIKLGAVLTGPGDTGDSTTPSKNWNRNVLLTAGANVDFGIIHYYANNGTDPATQDAKLLAAPRTDFANVFNRLRSDIQTYSGKSAANVELHMTEVGYFGNVGSPKVTALYAADAYAMAMTQGASSVDWLEMSKDSFLGDSSSLTRGPAFYALQAVSRFTNGGGDFYSISSPLTSLRAYAAFTASSNISLLLINEDLTNSVTVDLSFLGAAFSGAGLWYTTDGLTSSQSSLSFSYGTNVSIVLPASSINTIALHPFMVVPEPGCLMWLGAIPLALGRRVRFC